jgi:hypothetical protein
LKLYFDEELSHPVIEKEIDMGESWFEKQRIVTLWLQNDAEVPLKDITVDVLDADIKVEAPVTLAAHEKGKITFTFTPKLLKGIKTGFMLSAIEVYTP